MYLVLLIPHLFESRQSTIFSVVLVSLFGTHQGFWWQHSRLLNFTTLSQKSCQCSFYRTEPSKCEQTLTLYAKHKKTLDSFDVWCVDKKQWSDFFCTKEKAHTLLEQHKLKYMTWIFSSVCHWEILLIYYIFNRHKCLWACNSCVKCAVNAYAFTTQTLRGVKCMLKICCHFKPYELQWRENVMMILLVMAKWFGFSSKIFMTLV